MLVAMIICTLFCSYSLYFTDIKDRGYINKNQKPKMPEIVEGQFDDADDGQIIENKNVEEISALVKNSVNIKNEVLSESQAGYLYLR